MKNFIGLIEGEIVKNIRYQEYLIFSYDTEKKKLSITPLTVLNNTLYANPNGLLEKLNYSGQKCVITDKYLYDTLSFYIPEESISFNDYKKFLNQILNNQLNVQLKLVSEDDFNLFLTNAVSVTDKNIPEMKTMVKDIVKNMKDNDTIDTVVNTLSSVAGNAVSEIVKKISDMNDESDINSEEKMEITTENDDISSETESENSSVVTTELNTENNLEEKKSRRIIGWIDEKKETSELTTIFWYNPEVLNIVAETYDKNTLKFAKSSMYIDKDHQAIYFNKNVEYTCYDLQMDSSDFMSDIKFIESHNVGCEVNKKSFVEEKLDYAFGDANNIGYRELVNILESNKINPMDVLMKLNLI